MKKLLKKAKSMGKTALSYKMKNHLALLNLILTVIILVKLIKIEEKMFTLYLDLSAGLGYTFMAVIQVIQRLAGQGV